jgi:hypothetical protein
MSTVTAVDYRKAARRTLGLLTSVPAGNLSYWQLANSFDTMIDCLDHVDEGAAGDVSAMVSEQYDPALKKMDRERHEVARAYDAAWFDDFGWWTIATLRAESRPYFNEGFKRTLGSWRDECWSRFTENAPYVWRWRPQHPGPYEGYRPAFDGGVWNTYWAGTSPDHKGPRSDGPGTGDLAGIQNTVTNALYLMAAQRVGAADDAEREFGFLHAWFNAARDPLWWPVGTDAALVRERPSHFADGSKAPGFEPDWAWTGDLGLVLGALVDRMQRQPGERKELLRRTRELLMGARTALVSDGVLQPWKGDDVPGDANGEYRTGTGVFWRNVLHAWMTEPELHADLTAPGFQQVLRASANAALAAESDDTRNGTELTNDLAVLVAATVILQ